MSGLLEKLCPCLQSREAEDDFDVIPSKGDYHGSRDFTGARSGFGIYRFDNGDIYEGDWKKDKKHGFGEYRFRDGKILNGYFEHDNFIGDPPRSKSSLTSNSAQPLLQDDIKSTQKPFKVKENNLGYSFAKTVGDIKQQVEKKTMKKRCDEVDSSSQHGSVNERQRLMPPKVNDCAPTYSHVQGQSAPQMDVRFTEERMRQARERHEKHQARVDKIRKKYNIPGDRYVRT